MRRVTINHEGQALEGEELDWKVLSGEGWSEYECSDGTRLKMKTIVTKIVRLDKRGPDGAPIYTVSSANVLAAPQVQPHLMRESS